MAKPRDLTTEQALQNIFNGDVNYLINCLAQVQVTGKLPTFTTPSGSDAKDVAMELMGSLSNVLTTLVPGWDE